VTMDRERFAAAGVIRVPKVAQRHPFAIRRLPLISRLDYLAYRRQRKALRRLIGKPARSLLNLLYGLGMGGSGELAFTVGSEVRLLRFDARNLQYNTLYLPQYAAGYEPETVAVIERALAPEDVFFDVGANWGFFSLYLASEPAYRGRIFAFEPAPSSFADLSALVAAAGLGGRIDCRRIALSDREGSASLDSGGMRSAVARLAEGGSLAVPTARLDDLKLPPPALIKLDVEAHEGQAIAGALATIEAHRPFVIFESWRDEKNLAAVMLPFELLQARGYRFFLPAWLVENDGRQMASPTTLPARWPADLALVPFEPHQRLILAETSANIVACHEALLPELASRLARVPPGM